MSRKIELYNNLMNLVANNEAFFYRDYSVENFVYRVFDYRLASYTDWLPNDALHCRGTCFELDYDTLEPLRIASVPFRKFFNRGEVPCRANVLRERLEALVMTNMEHHLAVGYEVMEDDELLEHFPHIKPRDYNDIDAIYEKVDGSLMSSMTIGHERKLWLKSKGALFSEHAKRANKLLDTEEYKELKDWVYTFTTIGYTVVMEYTDPHPDYRIVVGYDKPQLTILGLVSNDIQKEIIRMEEQFPEQFRKFMVKNIIGEIDNVEQFINKDYKDLKGIEGFVIRWKDGYREKIKTDWYMVRHHIKDSINVPRRLYEAAVYDTLDDSKVIFKDDEGALQLIEEMEELVFGIYNHTVDMVERYYERNKHLPQKDYAILGKKELEGGHFNLAMAKYHGKEVDYRQWMVKNRKKLTGIEDDENG